MFDERLVVVGTGIRIVGQLTLESIGYLSRAERIFHVVEDPVAEDIFRTLNPEAESKSLIYLYQEGKPRLETYEAMVQTILSSVRESRLTVCAFYGHPGIMAYSGHKAIRLARAEGFKARMLPAVSAEDCLFADLGIDPATRGCQSYEATYFLRGDPQFDPASHLILWQVGTIGDPTFQKTHYNISALPLLVEKLLLYYPASHEITIYEAAVMIGCEPSIQTVRLEQFTSHAITPRSTVSVPPIQKPPALLN